MKMIILAVVPFVIGLAGATGIAVMNAPPPDPAADSTHVAASQHGGDVPAIPNHGAAPDAHGAAPGAGHANDSANDPPAASHDEGPTSHAPEGEGAGGTEKPAVVPLGAAPRGDAAGDSGFAEAGIARLSRILVNMKPKEAAQILAHLSDDEVDAILKAVGVRQAAALLTELPRERGAALSRRLIEVSGVEP